MSSKRPSKSGAGSSSSSKGDTHKGDKGEKGDKEDHGDKHNTEKKKTHSFLVNSMKFVIDTKYTPLKPLGRGAYGVVCSALDKSTNKKVAIKKIKNAFADMTDAKRILREVKLLRHFCHDNIVGLVDLAPSPQHENFDDIYIILDYMDTDLHKIIYSKQDLTDEHIQYFMYQLLRGLKYIHSANVIHRDLKPSNLLCNASCDLKICDFGLARGIKKEEAVDYELTEYVVTRWYRAPEVMCSCQEYDEKLDVWSAGCIFAELHGRKPLFPGDDYIKQMNLIFEVLGTPSEEDLRSVTNEQALEYIMGLETKPPIAFETLYPNANPEALDLLRLLLTFTSQKRITVDEALKHKYFHALHNPAYEPTADAEFNFDYESMNLEDDNNKILIQDLMFEEIYHFRPNLITSDPRGPAYRNSRKTLSSKTRDRKSTSQQAGSPKKKAGGKGESLSPKKNVMKGSDIGDAEA